MALILEQAAAGLCAPNTRRVVGRCGANDLITGLRSHLPYAILMLVKFADVGPDNGRRFKAGHNATRLRFQFMAGFDLTAAGRR